MALFEAHVGDIGTEFGIIFLEDGVIFDISTASAMAIRFKKPDKTFVSKTASFKTDGTDGHIIWVTTLATDIDQVGTWKIQGNVTLPSGQWSSEIGSFKVSPALI